jgi:hypothetical protein
MGTIPVTIDGVLLPKARSASDKPKAVVLVGQLNITGLSVGGGPIEPPPPDLPPPNPGAPTFPIWGPPGIDLPPVPGYPPVAGHPLPPLPDPPPDAAKPPAFVPIWHPDFGWIMIPAFPLPTPSR